MNDAADEGAKLPRDARPAEVAVPGSAAPDQLETWKVPGDDRLRLDHDQGPFPTGPEAAEQNPEHAVSGSNSRMPLIPLVGGQLLAQGQVLDGEASARPAGSPEP